MLLYLPHVNALRNVLEIFCDVNWVVLRQAFQWDFAAFMKCINYAKYKSSQSLYHPAGCLYNLVYCWSNAALKLRLK